LSSQQFTDIAAGTLALDAVDSDDAAMALERSTARAPRGTSGAALTGLRASPALRGPFGGAAACVAAVAIVTAAIWLLEPHVPVLSLGVLYVFAVLPVAVAWGWLYAVPVAVASMSRSTSSFSRRPTATLADSWNWLALAVYRHRRRRGSLALGARAGRTRPSGASEPGARRRRRRAVANPARRGLARIEACIDAVGISSVRVLGKETAARPHEAPHPLSVDGRLVATVYTPEREEGALRVQQQLLPALASLLAVARERERLEREAFGAEALRRSDAIKTALIQTVSHDLRTPLATIEQALDGLESGVLALTAEDREQLLRTIRVEHTPKRLSNLLDLSRLRRAPIVPSSRRRTSSWHRHGGAAGPTASR
jgi:two-component system sensor histidine kinase KdpD